jgi:signal transduction histidine kinase/CheY-like chemotaxis protein
VSRALANLKLRTKFLVSLVLVTALVTCATLLIVRRTAQVQMDREMGEQARNAILTFQVIQQEHQLALSHKADLLAALARMRNEEASTIQDTSEDPWQSDDCNLFALAGPDLKIVGLHTTTPGFPVAAAELMLRRSLRESATSDWWYSGGALYQVALQPIYETGPLKRKLKGAVVVGREIGARDARDLGRISSSQVIFRYGEELVISTIPSLRQQDFAQEFRDGVTEKEVRIDDEKFLARTIELTPGVRPSVSLTILKSFSATTAFLTRLNHVLLGLGLVGFFAGGILIFLISDTFTRPLAFLVEGVRALERGDFAHPLEISGGDEVAELTRAFDTMRTTLQQNESIRQRLENQLRQSQKMEAMGRLAGGIAHDFNNLLTVIKGHSSLLQDRLAPTDPLTGSSLQITKAADRAAGLTRQLLAFSRMQVLQPKVLDLNAQIADTEKLLVRLIREDIAFKFVPGESLGCVKADPTQIEQVLLNLTVNASDAMPRGGNLTIATHNVIVDSKFSESHPPMQSGDYVLLSVTDTGEGMNASTKARIFEPFFTTKELGKGTGLGLATVYGIVKQSGGCIWVDTELGQGSRFEVYLPRVGAPVEPARPEEIAPAPIARRKTVLIAEDEEAVRELATEFLSSAGYTVLAARDGKEALAIAEQSDEPISLLVTDVVMPNMRGPELAKQLKRLRPNLKLVYMSGYLEYNRDSEEFLEDAFFLQKPFSRDDLVSKVAEALTDYAPKRTSKRPAEFATRN